MDFFSDIGNISVDSTAKYACQIERIAKNRAKAIVAAMVEIGFYWKTQSTTVIVRQRTVQFRQHETLKWFHNYNLILGNTLFPSYSNIWLSFILTNWAYRFK